MPDRDTTQRPLPELRAQHDRIGALFSALSTRIGSMTRKPADTRLHAAVLHLVADLECQLPAHFAYEEAGGYLSEELATAPRLRYRVVQLQREHSELSVRLSRFAHRARAARPTSWADLGEEFRDFADAVRQHELEENRLIQEAFLDDLGGGS